MTTLSELREVLGDLLLQRFLAVFRGTNVRLPKSPRGAFFRELERVVGTDGAERVRQRFAGEKLYIPSSMEKEQRNAEIAARKASGESTRSISRTYREISDRQVRRIAAEMKARAK